MSHGASARKIVAGAPKPFSIPSPNTDIRYAITRRGALIPFDWSASAIRTGPAPADTAFWFEVPDVAASAQGSDGQGVTLKLPAGSFAVPLTISARRLAEPPTFSSILNPSLTGQAVQFGPALTLADQPADITLPHRPSAFPTKINHWLNGQWQALATSISGTVLTAPVSQLGLFAPIMSPLEALGLGTIAEAYAFPSPAAHPKLRAVAQNGLPRKVTFKIFNLIGEKLAQMEMDTPSELTQNGGIYDHPSPNLPSGVYVLLVDGKRSKFVVRK